MGFLERLENLIQGAVEGGTNTVLRSKLKPIEIEHQLERAMRDNTQVSRGGRIAPTSYTVFLHPDTYRETIAGVEGYNRHCEMLLNQYAMEHGYTLLHQRISVSFDADADLGRREVRIATGFAGPTAQPQPIHRDQPINNATHTQVIHAVQPSRYGMIVQRGAQPGQRFDLREGETRIGRSSESDVVLKDDRNTVSRNHAILTRYGNELRLRDVGSKNGTKVNGNYIPSHLETVVTDGAEITFGACVVRIEQR